MPIPFDLTSEPWIPVRNPDGSAAPMSLRAVLERAHELREIRDESPLVTVAVHRLLLCILHRVYAGPKTNAERLALKNAGRFDAARTNAYFDEYRERFDLFGGKFPFLQRGGFQTKERSGVNRLAQELARGNNPILFDHTMDEQPPKLSPAQCARLIVAEQAFAVGGGKSDTGNTTSAPLVSGAVVLVRGETIFETLWLNLTLFDRFKPIPSGEEDAPVWERSPVAPHEQPAVPRGYLDYLVWPARTICLHPEEGEDGQTFVQFVSYSQGRRCELPDNSFDPMIGYFRTDDGYKDVRFNEYRDLWRDSSALFEFEKEGKSGEAKSRGPITLQTLRSPQIKQAVSAADRSQLSVIGLCTDKAKVLFWRHDVLPLRWEYLEKPDLVTQMKLVLEWAEKVAKEVLRPAMWVMASKRLTDPGDAEAKADTKRTSELVDSLAAERFYWSKLELPFRQMVIRIADAAGDPETLDGLPVAWYREHLSKLVNEAYDRCTRSFTRSRDLRAVTIGRSALTAKLAEFRRANGVLELERAGAW